MAEVPVPPRKNKSKGVPPPETETGANLHKSNEGDFVPLTFKVPKEFKKDFRGMAFEEEIAMVDLLKKCFQEYKKSKYPLL